MNFQIIIPTYYSEKYIEKTVESVLNQTYNNYQIHIVDDYSTDKTVEIINKYLSNKKINIYQNEINLGKFKSINSILKKTNGDYFIILDGHDLIYPNRLEIENNIFQENPEILCVQSKVKKIDEQTNKIITTDKYNYTNETYSYELIKKMGYFNENRFGGNVEYLSRFIKFIGENKLFKINKILTIAIKRSDKFNLGYIYSNEYIENFILKIKKLHLAKKKEFFKTYNNNDLEKDINIELDLEFYKKSYLDLENMTNKQLKLHWDNIGKKEGRLPNSKIFKSAYPNFDFNSYLNINPYNINFKSNYDIYGWIYFNNNADYYDWLKLNGYIEENNKNIDDKKKIEEINLDEFIIENKIKFIYISKKINDKENKFIDRLIKQNRLNIYNQETDSYENVLFYGLYDINDYNMICLNNNKVKYLLWSLNYESFKDDKYYNDIFTRILKYYNIKHLIIDNKIRTIFNKINKIFYEVNSNINLNKNIFNSKLNKNNYVVNIIDNETYIKDNQIIKNLIDMFIKFNFKCKYIKLNEINYNENIIYIFFDNYSIFEFNKNKLIKNNDIIFQNINNFNNIEKKNIELLLKDYYINIFYISSFLDNNKIEISEKLKDNFFILTYESLFFSYNDLFKFNLNKKFINDICIIIDDYNNKKEMNKLKKNTFIKKISKLNYKFNIFIEKNTNIFNNNFIDILKNSKLFIFLKNDEDLNSNIILYLLFLYGKKIIHNNKQIYKIFGEDILSIYINNENILINRINFFFNNYNKINVSNIQNKIISEMNYIKQWDKIIKKKFID
jgi:glycosyltransferase involved in cell wall biosynthesis